MYALTEPNLILSQKNAESSHDIRLRRPIWKVGKIKHSAITYDLPWKEYLYVCMPSLNQILTLNKNIPKPSCDIWLGRLFNEAEKN